MLRGAESTHFWGAKSEIIIKNPVIRLYSLLRFVVINNHEYHVTDIKLKNNRPHTVIESKEIEQGSKDKDTGEVRQRRCRLGVGHQGEKIQRLTKRPEQFNYIFSSLSSRKKIEFQIPK